jgi:CHAT domain-containing protein
LVVGDGEILSVGEIMRGSLPADLAVFSACDTARGEAFAGEGVVGLARAGFVAGCPRLVVSLWKVEDRATRDLMRSFYGYHLGEGLRPAAALRRAQLERIDAGVAPAGWAGFVVWGAE